MFTFCFTNTVFAFLHKNRYIPLKIQKILISNFEIPSIGAGILRHREDWLKLCIKLTMNRMFFDGTSNVDTFGDARYMGRGYLVVR